MEEEVDNDTVAVGEASSGSRKRRKSGGKRASEKKERYAAPRGSNTFTACPHMSKRFRCGKIRPSDVKKIRAHLYSVPDKLRQDSIITSLIVIAPVSRRRPRPAQQNKKGQGTAHKFNVIYKINCQESKIPVCKKLFLAITKIGRTRLNNICKNVFLGNPVEERRGGDRVENRNADRKASVRNFISNLRGTESHYNRNKSKRIYLTCNLSIKKLHSLYNNIASNEEKVSLAMFRRVFVNDFNIGFRSPASDVCSYCSTLSFKIKTATREGKVEEKTKLKLEKRVHKQKANAFYTYLKQDDLPDAVTLCFDLQQIQPLPKSCIQEAYYSRQIGLYNLAIVNLTDKVSKLYTWTEEQAGKGSAEISSALLNYLLNAEFENKKELRLFCDGCVSQNKNNIVLRTLQYYLSRPRVQIEEIKMFFPVRGHSYLPADRIFGRIEKLLRKKQTIVTKEDYHDTFKEIAEVKVLGKDWRIFDTKALYVYYKDMPRISEMKRIHMKMNVTATGKNVVVKGSENFRFESELDEFVSLKKRGVSNKQIQRITLKRLPLDHAITHEKKKDVDNLLKAMFGENWAALEDQNFEWYKKILFQSPSTDVEEELEMCDCLEDDVAVKV